MRFQHICVLGLGYIGLPTASTFATHGLRVTGVDVNPAVLHSLQNGETHIYEPGLRTLVQAAVKSGNLSVSPQPVEADAYIIAVPTPFKEGKKADLSFVIAAAEAIVPVLRRGALVVLESTSPPRTTEDVVRPILERSGLKAGEDFHLAYSPERVLPGQILRELIENTRVIGGIDRASAEAGRDLYGVFVRGEIILTDATTAEMVKLMENTYRDVNIAIANEFARLAERFGINVWEAIALANRHPRVRILNPGPGVGGHCISVDPWFLVEAAPDLATLIRTAREVNDTQPHFVVERVRQAAGSLDGLRVAALGLAYKADVDDLRESPAIEVCHLLRQAGAQVRAYEPFKPDAHIEGVETVPTLGEILDEADVLLLLVGHTVLRNLDPVEVAQLTAARIVVDCVNGWEPERWQFNGFHYHRLGDRKHAG
ncbi:MULTISPECIES: UDP-N-acetyl-D-mannosamine dehydrogenase [Anaerolinea]|uniref:UDP-N-acetyl-D-mannosamine dehydrogenase n=1 Tax=Anaerolinea TaxID=233189 RepID=UPI002635E441|nr:UDP-N-acetyl-D-mannosamine dehydrogenase [Anaerolinea thermophila]